MDSKGKKFAKLLSISLSISIKTKKEIKVVGYYKIHSSLDLILIIMGSWGTGISSNDTFKDIKDEFFDLYNRGNQPAEITQQIIEANADLASDREEAHNFWFAVALCQWQCKALDPHILDRVTIIVRSGSNLKLRQELGAGPSEISKRKKILNKFLQKLNSERKYPKPRKKTKLWNAVFEKGACLSIRLSNGDYGAAFVLDAEYQSEYGFNLIAICEYQSSEPPTEAFFEDAKVLMSRRQNSPTNYIDEPLISWYMASDFKAGEVEIMVVGTLICKNNFRCPRYSFWDKISLKIEQQPKLVARYGSVTTDITLKSLRL